MLEEVQEGGVTPISIKQRSSSNVGKIVKIQPKQKRRDNS